MTNTNVTVSDALKNGGFDIKLSAIIMGFANFANKQLIKGSLFLLSQIVFLIAFFTQIIPAVHGLITLGTQTQGMVTKEIDGIKLQVAVDGDNSMLMLIFGLLCSHFLLGFRLYLLV